MNRQSQLNLTAIQDAMKPQLSDVRKHYDLNNSKQLESTKNASQTIQLMDPDYKPDITDPFENHHLLPRQLERRFSAVGLNIDDSVYLIKIRQSEHRIVGAHNGRGSWNSQWEKYLITHPAATANDILETLGILRAAFGI